MHLILLYYFLLSILSRFPAVASAIVKVETKFFEKCALKGTTQLI